jgi:hypothetical protein
MAKSEVGSSDVNLKYLVRGQDERNHAHGICEPKKVNMSAIEQLKAEAVALRAAEKALGRVLGHSDALEQVARKHGYANWRAALALLGENAPPPALTPTAGAAAAEPSAVAPSRLQDGDHELARQSAFTRWMSRELRQAAVEFSGRIGLAPIYAETSRDGTRYLFWHVPAGARCEVRSNRTKEQFLEFDRTNRTQGRRLASLHVSADQAYSAVWISSEHHAAAADFLRRFGIAASGP